MIYDKFFNNYEIIKLEIFHPDYTNFLLILLFFLGMILTTRKEVSGLSGNSFLSISHTDQLRGLAIYFVVLGHLWVHVSKTKAQIILSEDSVSLFLILSGFGLTISSRNKFLGFKNFCFKRIKRVMVQSG